MFNSHVIDVQNISIFFSNDSNGTFKKKKNIEHRMNIKLDCEFAI